MKSTKELALELGLLKKRSRKDNGTHGDRRARQTNQIFSYLIVIDFEATCWEDQKYRQHEIIEFPAVLLNAGNGKVEAEFHYYVQPQENPVLSEFCRKFTGITQEQVDEGVAISQCLQYFKNWLAKIAKERNLIYNKFDGERKSCTFVTWSDWDFGVCLQYECRRKQLRKPPELDTWIDLRATYRKFYARKPQGLNGALKDVGISFEGREHSGLHDAINTAKLAWRMMSDGCVMQITKSGGQNRVTEHIQRIKRLVTVGTSTASGSEETVKKSTHSNEAGKRVPSCLPTNVQNNESTVNRKRQYPQETDLTIKSDRTTKVQKVDHIVDVKQMRPFSDSTNVFKTPELPASRLQTLVSQIKSPCKGSHSKRNQEFSFKTPILGTDMSSSNQSNVSNERNGTLSTPNNSSCSIGSNSLMKRTPPMCGCGRRAQRKIVQSPGPNQGRIFFCCPSGRKKTMGCFGPRNAQSGCGYFKWEQPSPHGGTSAQKCNATWTPNSRSMSSALTPPIVQPNFNTPLSAVNSTEKCKKKTLGLLRLSQNK